MTEPIDIIIAKFGSGKIPFNKRICQPLFVTKLDEWLIKSRHDQYIYYNAICDYIMPLFDDNKMKSLHTKLKNIMNGTEAPPKIAIKLASIVSTEINTPVNEVVLNIKSIDPKSILSHNIILKFVEDAHEIVYTAENIEGESALNDIMNLLFLKAIAPILSDVKKDGYIDLFNKSYYIDSYDNDELDDLFLYFKDMSLMINLDKIKNILTLRDLDNTTCTDIITQMGVILCMHPITKQIFTEKNFLKAREATTVIRLIKEIIKLDINMLYHNEDTIGEIYEYFVNYAGTGTKLGQFFTPRKMMKLLLSYKKDKFEEIISLNKTIHKQTKVLDTCMGTGGWLVSFYNMFREADILLSGTDVKPTTFQYGLMNLILALSHFPHEMNCDSSLTTVNKNKHHIIITNPPFQTGKKFADIEASFNIKDKVDSDGARGVKLNDVYHIKNNSPPVQFLEMNSYKLKKNGICIIILPYGDLFSGSSNKKMRLFFMDNYNITDIIVFPSGVFTHTGIKTAALVYEKSGCTKEINFIEAAEDCTILTKIFTISAKIIKNNELISWYYPNYVTHKIYEAIKENIILYKLGEIVSFKNGTGLKKSNIILGEFPVIGGGKKPVGFHNDYNRNENVILCSSSGSAGYISKYDKKIWASDCFSIDPDITIINNDYLYYLLKHRFQEEIFAMQLGAAQPHVYSYQLADLIIPVPPIKKQTEIIIYLDYIYDNYIYSTNHILKIEMLNKLYINQQLEKLPLTKLGSICSLDIGGTPLTKHDEYYTNGTNLWVSIKDLNYDRLYETKKKITDLGVTKSSVKLLPIDTILLSFKLTIGKVAIAGVPLYTNEAIAGINSLDNTVVLNKYLYYYLSLTDISQDKSGIIGNGSLNKDKLNNLDIKLPTIEHQHKIISYLDHNENIIKLHKHTIKNIDYDVIEYLNTVI